MGSNHTGIGDVVDHLEGDELRIAACSLLTLLCLTGCRTGDRLLLPKEAPLSMEVKPRGTLFKSSSFWDLARTVERNAPRPGEAVFRKGQMSFSGRKYKNAFDFEYQYRGPKHWELILFEKGTSNRRFSLHRNHLGLTMQDVQDQLFEQSYEKNIWALLAKHPWFDGLEAALRSLQAPKFSPELDWHEEVDGLKYYVITRVEQAHANHQAIKHEVYLHKKSKILSRHIQSKMDVGIVQNVKYFKYKAVGEHSYMPHGVIIELPKAAKRVDVNIEETRIDASATPPGPLREL